MAQLNKDNVREQFSSYTSTLPIVEKSREFDSSASPSSPGSLSSESSSETSPSSSDSSLSGQEKKGKKKVHFSNEVKRWNFFRGYPIMDNVNSEENLTVALNGMLQIIRQAQNVDLHTLFDAATSYLGYWVIRSDMDPEYLSRCRECERLIRQSRHFLGVVFTIDNRDSLLDVLHGYECILLRWIEQSQRRLYVDRDETQRGADVWFYVDEVRKSKEDRASPSPSPSPPSSHKSTDSDGSDEVASGLPYISPRRDNFEKPCFVAGVPKRSLDRSFNCEVTVNQVTVSPKAKRALFETNEKIQDETSDSTPHHNSKTENDDEDENSQWT